MNERNETTVSASREKKIRQETGKELTPKQLKAQQAAKKNTAPVEEKAEEAADGENEE